MASSSTASGGPDITALKTQLYDACLAESEDHDRPVFHQAAMFDFDIIPNNDINLLLQVCQKLVDEKLFKLLTGGNGILEWMLRSEDEAKKYRSLTAEQEIVYAIIDESGGEGIWSKTIKAKTNLHDAVFRASIKFLEGKNMISDMKSVEHPTRKMYIKSSIRPSDRATGGPWFTDGILDEEFIDSVMNILYNYIVKRTFYYASEKNSPKKARRVVKKVTPEEAKAARAKSLGPRSKPEEHDDQKPTKKKDFERYFPMPAGYRGYPSLNELTSYIENSPFTQQVLAASEIQQLLDIMCYDDRIERVASSAEGYAYKALRKSLIAGDEISSMLTEAPCGRCPVFDLCEEGGPVGPSNCEYFNDWLNTEG